MSRTVFINGTFCAPEDAKVSIFDRGLLFADAVYEVAGVIDGKLMDFAPHMQRLDRSLNEMGIPESISHEEILSTMRELVRRNQVKEGLIYMQITRGSTGDRDFPPDMDMTPTVFMFAQHKSDTERDEYRNGIAMVSQPDIRWARRDIKTVGLMGSVFAKWQAKLHGGKEALMHEDGVVTEGGATSFYIVKANTIITRPLSNAILPGCTRKSLLSLLDQRDIKLDERLFTLEEARGADEAFITGASTYVCPVIKIDDHVLGSGTPGPVTREMQNLYLDFARSDAI